MVISRLVPRFLSTNPLRASLLMLGALGLFAVGCGSKGPAKPYRPESGAGTIEQAEQWLANNRTDKASSAVKELLIAQPGNPRVIFLAAKLKAADGSLAEAVELLNGIPSDDAEAFVAALGQSADWLLTLERWDEAEARLNRILSLVPNATAAHRRLGELLNRQGRRQEAAEHARALCRLGEATDSELHSLLSVPVAFYDQSGRIPGQTPIGVLAEARIAVAQGDMRRALERLDQGENSGKIPAAQQAFHGRVLMLNQLVERMPQWLAKCDEATQELGDFWFAIGTWMSWEGRYREAATALAQAIRIEPTDRVAYRRLAECLARLDSPDASTWCIKRSEQIDKTFELAYQAGSQGKPEPMQMQRLADAIDDLNRPYESLMWHFLAAQQARVPDQVFEALETERDKLRSSLVASPEIHLPPAIRLAEEAEPDLAFLDGLTADEVTLPTDQVARVVRGDAKFHNVAGEVGLQGRYLNREKQSEDLYLLHTGVGGGVAVIDYDLDGRPDLYFPQGASNPNLNDLSQWQGIAPNMLFRNRGRAFHSVTEAAGADDRGYGQGVTAGDVNADGFPDLFIANIGHNTLLINCGDGTFRDASVGVRVDPSYWTTSVAIADISGDHLADLIEANYVGDPDVFIDPMLDADPDQPPPTRQMPRPLEFRSAPDRVFLSQPDGTISSQTLRPKQGTDDGTGLAMIVTDIDGQDGNELLVVNDMRANHLWSARQREDGALEFTDSAIVSGCAYSNRGNATACMGVAASDFNRDGMIDLAVTNFYREPMCFYQQTSSGFFADVAARVNLFALGNDVNGFGTQPIDYDNNGRMDLVVINGHIYDNQSIGVPFRMLPQLIDGSGERFELVDTVDDASGYWETPTLGRALATLDWNRDGRLDLVVTHLDQPHALIENRSENSGNWLQLRLIGTVSERDAIGAKIRITAGSETWFSTVNTGDGFECKNEPVVSFGLGEATQIENLTVVWPSGETQEIDDVQINHRYLVVEGDDQAFRL